eukprot:306348-Amphidinium_carterae.1
MKRVASSTLMTEGCALTSCLSYLERKGANLAHYIVTMRKFVSVGQCKKAALETLTASDTLQFRKLHVRWHPHEWNLSDSMTKMHGHAELLMRLTLSRLAQLLPEATHLQNRAEREEMG